MFRDAKVRDRVWSVSRGWGDIIYIGEETIRVHFDKLHEPGHYYCYYKDGAGDYDVNPTLFWDEVKIVPPPKPKRKVKKYIDLEILVHSVGEGEINVGLKGQHINTYGYPCKQLGQPIHVRHEYEVEE